MARRARTGMRSVCLQRRRGSMVAVAIALLLTSTAALPAQGTLGERIDAVRDGTLRFTFEAREGVCGHGAGWSRTDGTTRDGGGRMRDVEFECEPGPVRLVVERRDGRTTGVRTYVGGRWRASGSVATDLGSASAADAVEWLVTLAERGPEASAKDAVVPLTIAAAPVPWSRVLAVAGDAARPRAVRTQAMFWAAQAAGERASEEIGVIARTDPDREIRTQAVFALSRRDDGVEQLLRIARESKDRDVKQSAYFWLGQSKDPRAAALFAEVLARP